MSRRNFRKRRRLAADWILNQLSTTYGGKIEKRDGNEVYVKEYTKCSINKLSTLTSEYSIALLRDASHMLCKNEHVCAFTNTINWNETELKCNINGEYAFLDGFYLAENRRDFNELIDSYAKWIVPTVAVVISIIAIFLSTCNDGKGTVNRIQLQQDQKAK